MITNTIVLGIETSCDETAAAVVLRDQAAQGRILSNVVRAQWEAHQAFGGVVPEIAARAHVDVLDEVIAHALGEADVRFSDIDGVAATAGPGLIGGVLVGLTTGKAIALARGLPFVGVNHLEAHALTVGLSNDLAPPYLLLLVSGGHTQLLIVRDVGTYERLGTTVDDALGEAFDKVAKLLGLGYPGGPLVEERALAGDPVRFVLPRPMKGRKVPHFSFAGLKTAVRHAAQTQVPLTDQDIADLCASFQQAVVETVSDRVGMAMAEYEKRLGPKAPRLLVVAGGVAANKAIAKALNSRVATKGYTLCVPPVALCTDNGAMIAWVGAERLARGWINDLDFAARARWPLDPKAPATLGAGVKA